MDLGARMLKSMAVEEGADDFCWEVISFVCATRYRACDDNHDDDMSWICCRYCLYMKKSPCVLS